MCRAMLVHDFQSKESMFAVSLICLLSGSITPTISAWPLWRKSNDYAEKKESLTTRPFRVDR